MRTLLLAAGLVIGLIGATSSAYAQDNRVIVNKQALSTEQVGVLEYVYGPIHAGAYWYDAVSGLWGDEGAPPSGQIAAGLSLGGPLRRDASSGHSSVFFNGREASDAEVTWLRQTFGVVYEGRYWLNPQGIGGAEGGPAMFSLVKTGSAASAQRSGGDNDFYSGGTIDRGYGGTYGSDGSCYYISVEGADVLGPNC